MRLKLVFLSALILTVVATAFSSQIWREATVQPPKLEVMRNLGLDASRSEAPVSLPREWGHLVSVQKTDALNYSMFLENDAGEIYIVNLIQKGQYFYLNTYDYGATALVIKRGP